MKKHQQEKNNSVHFFDKNKIIKIKLNVLIFGDLFQVQMVDDQ